MIMKPIMSALVALAALAAVGSTAHAAFTPRDAGARQIEQLAQSRHAQRADWSEQDQMNFWEEQQDRGG
jgi:hypothetical protein